MLLASLLIILLWNVDAYFMLLQDIVAFEFFQQKNMGQFIKR